MSPGCPDPKSHLAVPSLQVSRMDQVVTMLNVSLIGASAFLAWSIVAWLGEAQTVELTLPPPDVDGFVRSGEESLPRQPQQIETPDQIDETAPANEQTISFLPAELLAEAGLVFPTSLAVEEVTEDSRTIRKGLPTEVEGADKEPIGGRGRRTTRTWQIELGSNSLNEYQRQLGQLGIDISAKSGDGTVVTLSFDDQGKMAVSQWSVEQAASNPRFAMVVENGDTPLGRADAALFRQAGVRLDAAEFVHYFSRAAELQLERLERAAAGQSDVRSILRTEFSVRPADGRYEFFVTEQIIR